MLSTFLPSPVKPSAVACGSFAYRRNSRWRKRGGKEKAQGVTIILISRKGMSNKGSTTVFPASRRHISSIKYILRL